MTDSGWTVRTLRRRWKPSKEQLSADGDGEVLRIRLHRAFSWLARAEQLAEAELADDKLVMQWIAFNALYGQWDAAAREPQPDMMTWRAFISRMLELDGDGHVPGVLTEQRRLVLSILEDEHLSKWFWEEPTDRRAGQSRKAYHESKTWYIEKRWAMILDRLLERVYLLRCQLVHGASTRQGDLNRTVVRQCTIMLDHLLPAILLVLIDHGHPHDWGELCYPPLR